MVVEMIEEMSKEPVVPECKGYHTRTFDGSYALENTDNSDARSVVLAVGACADSWVPEARLVGDVRAGDIVKALAEVLGVEYQGEKK